ncbi:MAG: phage holin family protein [Caldilineaceae bacterium]|nr:phage holin family protein [Caldilineaceae bacterium]
MINGLVLALIALLQPGITIIGENILTLIILGLVFGLLNAFVKPVVQFLTLPLLFVTYGVIIIIINALMLSLLAFLMSNRIEIDGFLPALIGGIIFGILSTLLENIFGVSEPIIDTFAGETDRLMRVPTLPIEDFAERGGE